jgi:DNA-binding transcriptional regulator GbsR (MarR family)
MSLEKSKALFIRRWGEMGATWGISRTMAEIHALLYIASEPLCTDDVMEQLQISRGNASMNLRQLADWGLIHKVHRRGDRKEYFSAETDVWQIFETITRERRRRELQPVVDTIRQCAEMVEAIDASATPEVTVYRQRLANMQAFLGQMHDLLSVLLQVKGSGLLALMQSIHKLAS